MKKYGVKIDDKTVKTAGAAKVVTCPRCGAKVKFEGQVLWCPDCGTEPFENTTDKKAKHEKE